MNESLLLRFTSRGRPRNIRGFQDDLGVTFEEHADASPLTLALGVQPVQPARLQAVRQRHGWGSGQFLLDARVDAGALRLSGADGDPQGLPSGPYDITVELESYKFTKEYERVVIPDGGSVTITLEERIDPRRVVLHDNVDEVAKRIIGHERSMVDGVRLIDWLRSAEIRPQRQACLLNVFCKLRAAMAADRAGSLLSLVNFVFMADVDRAYAACDAGLRDALERLVRTEAWVCEGTPRAPIHRELIGSMARLSVPEAERFELTSYRQGGRNCLQIVVATPPPGVPSDCTYADIDIDLGNPLWDAEGLIIHASELLDPGRTDHLALRSKLDRGDTSDFLCYDITRA